MKQLMFLFLISSCIIYSQNNYVADLVIESLYWQNDDEWASYLRADLYLDGTLLDPQSTYYYSWQRIENNVWKELLSSGFGIIHSKMNTDGHANQTWIYRVQITGHGFSVISESKLVGKYGTIHLLDCYAYKENGSSANDDVNINVWATYKWYQKSPGLNRTYFLSEDETNYLKDSVLSPQQFGQFFNMWDTDIGSKYYKNHEGIFVTEDMTKINVRHKRHNSGILNFYLTSEIPSLNISIIDPWFVDTENQVYYQAPYGYRNLGLSAIPEEVMNGVYGGVFLNQDPTFDPNIPNYSISIPSSIYLPQTGQTHNLYLQSWTADPSSGADFEDADSDTTGVVFKNDGVIITANVKATQLSDNPNAYANNSQRKFIKTPDGHLHSVYSSMGRVWYERSTDDGTSWELMQSGNPLDNGQGKDPSIDYLPGNNNYGVMIAFQEKYGNNYKIVIMYYPSTANTFSDKLITSVTESYNNNATPIITVDANNDFTILWKQQAGFYARTGYQAGEENLYFDDTQSTYLTGTNSYMLNPSMSVNKSLGHMGTKRFLVWDAPGINNTMDIFYCTLDGTDLNLPAANISDGSGYNSNTNPFISLANEKPIVSWTGDYNGEIYKISAKEMGRLERIKAVVRRGPYWGSFTELGNDVNFVNNNSATTSIEKSVIIWSEGNSPQSKWVRRTGGNYNSINNLSHSGIQNQVSGGTDYQNMTSMVFNNQSVPYYFTKSTTDFSIVDYEDWGNISKITASDTILTYGRSGIASKNRVEFVFSIGDIFVGDSSIQFVPIPDTLLFESTTDLNEVAKTEDFWLAQNTGFYFSNLYYVIRQELADSALTEQDQVNFKVELIKSQTGEVLGMFDNITYNKYNLEKYSSINYQVNCSGIQAGEYFLRLVTSVNGPADYNISNILKDNSLLNKLNYKTVSFSGETTPVTYELMQNYPNPFNPSTTIKYQIPASGNVTLKIYDILGREVTTLVNEEKASGRYEVSFNASSLASGVYLYRIKVNDYIAVKKMILLK